MDLQWCIPILEKYRDKAHPDGRHFLKVQYESGIKIKTKRDPKVV
jgi:hypothetical protein